MTSCTFTHHLVSCEHSELANLFLSQTHMHKHTLGVTIAIHSVRIPQKLLIKKSIIAVGGEPACVV